MIYGGGTRNRRKSDKKGDLIKRMRMQVLLGRRLCLGVPVSSSTKGNETITEKMALSIPNN